MAGVAVRASNKETGVAASAVTNEAGRFEIPFLLPGTYTLTAEIAGFKRFVRDAIQVRTSEAVEVPIRMELGATSDTVEVKAQTPLLDTSDASLGRVIDEKRVSNLPERGGNPMELELLAPGVVNATNVRLRKPSSPDALSSVSTDGNPQTKNEYQIDGIFDGAADGGRGASRIAFSPPSGAVREFKIQTSPYDASQGHSMGAVMSVTTASGTNALHGEAHFFARNSAFDAPNFFNNKSGTQPGKYRDDRYGFTVGGPVYILSIEASRSTTGAVCPR
jgi:Carboxypeptidase regulatory-like domain